MPINGRGGTDFAPALDAVIKLNPKPDICIYLTDGDGSAPETKPRDMEVIWCIVPSYYNTRPCSWGHLIVMSDDPTIREKYDS
jgi:predicted metal-dependent peptidase